MPHLFTDDFVQRLRLCCCREHTLVYFLLALPTRALGQTDPVIDIDGYGVDVDGSGSVSVSGSDELNYRGLAEITNRESFFTNTIAPLSGATLKDGKLQFPFRIGGTIDSPVFSKGKGDMTTPVSTGAVRENRPAESNKPDSIERFTTDCYGHAENVDSSQWKKPP